MLKQNECNDPTIGKSQISLKIIPNEINNHSNLYQLIHLESILGGNIAILAKFICEDDGSNGGVKVTKVVFTKYPMFGIWKWGFKKDKTSINGKKITFGIGVELIGENDLCDSIEIDYTTWGSDIPRWQRSANDTTILVENELSFYISNILIESFEQLREELKSDQVLKEEDPLDATVIPTHGRPCQFLLAKEF